MICNRAQLADIFGTSLPTIDKWTRNGCPFDEQGGSGRQWRYDTAKVHAWLLAQAAEEFAKAYGISPGETISLPEARRRMALAQMTLAEMELAREMGTVVDVEYVTQRVGAVLATLRQALAHLGPTIAGRAASMNSAPKIREMVDDLIRRAVNGAIAEMSAAGVGPKEMEDAER